MPANLTPQYKDAEKRFRSATDDSERMVALQEMLRVIPKHKGTEKLQAEIKAKIAKLKKADAPKGGGARQKSLDSIPHEGAAVIPLVGAPNSGKSQFLETVTNAKSEVAEYPFTTRTPIAGMMLWENVQFELVDLPPVAVESYEGWMTSILFRADAVFLFADLSSDDLLEDVGSVIEMLDQHRISLQGPHFEMPDEDYSLDEVVKKTFLVANKYDCDEDDIRLGFLTDALGDRFPIYKVNSVTGEGAKKLETDLFSSLKLLRVYTKHPGHEADMTDPVVLSRPATVADAAYQIHKDFAEKLVFARIWGEGKHDGQRVKGDFEVTDGDIVEFHI